MFEDIILARGTAQYYAMEALFRHVPPRAPHSRPSKHRLRRALAWLFSKSGRALSSAGSRLQPAATPGTATLQGCG